MEYRKQDKITNRNTKKIINSRCRKCCFESNYNFDAILLRYFYLNTSLQKYTVISIKQESFHADMHVYISILKLKTFFPLISQALSANRALPYKFFCIKKIYQLIRVLCFLETVTRCRKEVDATKPKKIVQIACLPALLFLYKNKELFRIGKLS